MDNMSWTLLIIYFFPAFNGYVRRHRNGHAILLFNLLLGWTFLGWILALVWSATSNVKKIEPIKWRW